MNRYYYTVRAVPQSIDRPRDEEWLIAGETTTGSHGFFTVRELIGAVEIDSNDTLGDILFRLTDGRRAWFQSIDLDIHATTTPDIHRTIAG